MKSIEAMLDKADGKQAWTLFIDLKSAFDKVDHKLLIEKLKKKGVSKELINTIQWLYANTKIKVNGKEIGIGRGVIQGGILSPTLFLVMFDDLLDELENHGFEDFAFADDLSVNGIGDEKLH